MSANSIKSKRPAAKAAVVDPKSGTLFIIGLICLLVAIGSSGMLSAYHLGGISLPGCGAGSACDAATNSKWGKIPGIDWPMSFLGFSYFVGAIVAWLLARGGIPTLMRWVVRLGALGSLGFMLIIIFGDYHCQYCLASHGGNFGFWIVVELARKSRGASLRPLAALVGTFALASLILGIAEFREKADMQASQQVALDDSLADIIAASKEKAEAAANNSNVTPPPDASNMHAPSEQPVNAATTQPAATDAPPTQTAPSAPAGEFPLSKGFTGRYRLGPAKAPIRLLMITDYQCVDCNRIEDEVRPLLDKYPQMSLTIKHFPMCPDCNPRFKQNKHPNACWAARAAEAAGILRGNEGFWQMHFWLFDHDGSFKNEELQQGLAEMGYDYKEFTTVMMGDETLRRVQADIEEAVSLGLMYTPMAFINGKELRGVFARNAIPRAIEQVAAQNLPPLGPEVDSPAWAAEKYIGDWREGGRRPTPPDPNDHPLGSSNPKVDILVYGGYEEPITAGLDGILRGMMQGRDDCRYSFRNYPFDQTCNPNVSKTLHKNACRMSRAAEAAGLLGGDDAFWRMHVWLIDNVKSFSDEALRRAAAEQGLDPDALFAKMESPEVEQALKTDIAGGKRMIPRGIPTLYINGRWVPRFELEGHDILGLIFAEAEKETPPAARR